MYYFQHPTCNIGLKQELLSHQLADMSFKVRFGYTDSLACKVSNLKSNMTFSDCDQFSRYIHCKLDGFSTMLGVLFLSTVDGGRNSYTSLGCKKTLYLDGGTDYQPQLIIAIKMPLPSIVSL